MTRYGGVMAAVAIGLACAAAATPQGADPSAPPRNPSAVAELLKAAAHEQDAHDRDRAFSELTKEKSTAWVEAVVAKGVKSGDVAVRRVAVEVLGVIEPPGIEEVLLPLLDAKDEGLRIAAAATAGIVRSNSARPALVKLADDDVAPLLRSIAVESVSRIGGEDTLELLERWVVSPYEPVAASALHQFWWHDKERGAARVAEKLAAEDLMADGPLRPLLVQAIEEAVKYRAKSSLAPLVALLRHPRARARDMAWQALLEVTGLEIPNVAADWEQWWKHYGDGFAVPPKPGKRAQNEQRSQARFYGIPIVSDRVVFVIDYSGSMKEPGSDGRPKIDGARDALAEVLEKLPDGTEFNLVAFSTQPRKWRPSLQKKTKSTCEAALQFARGTSPGGWTNVYDSLIDAMTLENVDTVVLLSDGAPSAGTYEYFSRIRYHVRLANRTRKVAVSSVALQTSEDAKKFLRELAKDTGGEFVER